MASPGRQDKDIDLQEQYGRHWRRGGRRGGWWVFWLLVIIGIVWFAGWGWWGYGGWWWGTHSSRVAGGNAATYQNARQNGGNGSQGPAVGNQSATRPQNAATGTGLALLNSTDKQAFVGDPFNVQDVSVQTKVNDRVLWVTAQNQKTPPILVVLKGPENNTKNADINSGDRIQVTGTVERAPEPAQAMKEWRLQDSGVNRLKQEGVYVLATQIQTLGNRARS